MTTDYYTQLVTVILVSIAMVISPGQDFAIVTRNSLLFSRRAGILSALGIFLGIWVHVMYSLAGIALIISKSPTLYSVIKYLGAAYLLYLGIKSFINKENKVVNESSQNFLSDLEALRNGFMSNALNPKTTLFFLSIFTQVIDPDTPLKIQFLYGFIIAVAHILWFMIVAYFFSSKVFLSKFNSKKKLIDRITGAILIIFAIKILTIA